MGPPSELQAIAGHQPWGCRLSPPCLSGGPPLELARPKAMGPPPQLASYGDALADQQRRREGPEGTTGEEQRQRKGEQGHFCNF